MPNNATGAAWQYHDATKHSAARLGSQPHYLDWDNKPAPFKTYRDVESVALPRRIGSPNVSTIAALAAPTLEDERGIDFERLARLLYLCAGIMRARAYGDDVHYFRAAACTGALYHIDVYIVSRDLEGLTEGVYQFEPRAFALNRLRAGDFRGNVAAASGGEPNVGDAPVTLALASTYWRNSWKYRSRAYRHCFWDAGTMLANLLGAAAGDRLHTSVVGGFVDAEIEALLGLDAEREGALALVAFGRGNPTPKPLPVTPLSVATEPLSRHEIDYPAIREMQEASKLSTDDEARTWRDAAGQPRRADSVNRSTIPLCPIDPAALPDEILDEVIRRRGSSRRFAQDAIRFDQLSTILQSATGGIPADWGESTSTIYLIVNAVDGLAPGTYVYHPCDDALELLREGELRPEAGYLDLGQELAADAAVNLYMLCDLEPVLQRFGNRGYRVAQLDAAIIGGKIYLAAYALRLGATGLTFFDDDVVEFFSPHAAGKSVMFLAAVGHGRKAQGS